MQRVGLWWWCLLHSEHRAQARGTPAVSKPPWWCIGSATEESLPRRWMTGEQREALERQETGEGETR
jgi:hypothetical protein